MKKWITITTLIVLLSLSGCSGTGFDKRATLMPDRIGISIDQRRFQQEEDVWTGITLNAQWDLK